MKIGEVTQDTPMTDTTNMSDFIYLAIQTALFDCQDFELSQKKVTTEDGSSKFMSTIALENVSVFSKDGKHSVEDLKNYLLDNVVSKGLTTPLGKVHITFDQE